MGFSKPSVSRAMGLLKDGGYVMVDSRGAITLTEKGLDVAKKMYEITTVINQMDGEKMIDHLARYTTPVKMGLFHSLKDLTDELGMLDTAKEQIAVLENALKDLDANFKTWQVQESERRKEEQEQERKRREEMDKIRREQERIRDTITDITEGSNSPFIQIRELQKALKDLIASGSDDSALIAALREQIKNLEDQLYSNMKLVDTLTLKVKEAEDYTKDIADIQKAIEALKELGTDNAYIADQIKALEEELAKLEEKNEGLSTNFRDIRSTLDNFGRRINNMPTVVDIKTAVDEAKTDLTQQFNTQINNKITGLTADLSSLTLTVGDLSSQLTTATKDLTLVSGKVDKVQIGLTDVQDKLEETNSSLTNLSTTVKSSGGTVKATTTTGSTPKKVSTY
jgi:chromosome segregation ATPase